MKAIAMKPTSDTTGARFPEYGADTRFAMLIDGEWVQAADGRSFSCRDPYENIAWGQIPLAGATDVDRAVDAAQRAFPAWSALPPAGRGALLRRLAAAIEASGEELARLQVRENGKTISEMRAVSQSLAGDAHYFAALAEMAMGETFHSNIPGHEGWTTSDPIGVIGAITPWNNPLGLLGWKLWPALAAGNCIVIKPSEVTPASTLVLARLAVEAGLPKGVINVVTGDGTTGAALASHPRVDKIAFTGSTATGKAIARAAIDRMARVTLELGGKSPNIVFADANLDRAVEGLVTGLTAGMGQACNAGSRLLIQASVYDEVRDRLAARLAELRIGDPLDPAVHLGPLASEPQFKKVCSYFDIAQEEGLTAITGGKVAHVSEAPSGFFVEPTIYDRVPASSRLVNEEIFGPVGVMMPFEDEAEAVRIANDSSYGLVAGLWSQDVSRVHRMIGALRSGTVWANTWRLIHRQAPFGGVRQSGWGRELGVHALKAYMEPKTVWLSF
jgi:aldehyde dehydrogenase (NAD+)